MDYIVLIGLAAGAITTISFLPQIIKVYGRKSAKDISWLWLIGFFSGIFLWIVYGVMTPSMPVLAANLATFILGIVLISFKVKYG